MKNLNKVIYWFSKTNEKHICKVMQLHMKDIYPSISKEMLNEILQRFKPRYLKRTFELQNSGKSLLFSDNQTRKKSNKVPLMS